MPATLYLYSKRFSIARGWHWKYERDCAILTSQDWLRVFQKDEPEVEFKLTDKRK